MANASLLSVESLSVSFGAHRAVRDLSFDIAAGETLALVGESGSGKSATALSILRLIEREGGRITGGRIWLRDGARRVDLADLPDARMPALRGRRISMVFQEPMTSLNPVMRIGEQLAEVLRRHQGIGHGAALAAAKRTLDQVRIPDPARRLRQYPHELSGGLRQRVLIAIALACRPQVLIADEPTTALDVTTQAEVLRLLKTLQAELGMAVLFITHDMGVVAEVADRVVVLRHGVTEETARVADLFAAPKSDYARDLMAATPRLGQSPLRPPVREAAPVLSVRGLSKSFRLSGGVFRPAGAVAAVRNVSFDIRPGETLGLVGESGCGKSTLSRALMRLVEPDAGRVTLAGDEITGLDAEDLRRRRAGIQMVFQDPFASLNPRMKVRDLITEPAYLHGGIDRATRSALAADLLQKVALEPEAADRYPHHFSGGQRQRLCTARALSVSPRVIIADEAVSALDVSTAARITALLQEIQDRLGIAFLFISHDIAVVERVSHRIAVMWRGEIVETGPTDRVLRRPEHPYTQKLLAAVPQPDPSVARGGRVRGPHLVHG